MFDRLTVGEKALQSLLEKTYYTSFNIYCAPYPSLGHTRWIGWQPSTRDPAPRVVVLCVDKEYTRNEKRHSINKKHENTTAYGMQP